MMVFVSWYFLLLFFFLHFFNTACIVEIKHYCTEMVALWCFSQQTADELSRAGFRKPSLCLSCFWTTEEGSDLRDRALWIWWWNVVGSCNMTGKEVASWVLGADCRMIKTIFRCLGPAQSQPHQIACGKVSKLVCSCRHRTSRLTAPQGIRSKPPMSCGGMHTKVAPTYMWMHAAQTSRLCSALIKLWGTSTKNKQAMVG